MTKAQELENACKEILIYIGKGQGGLNGTLQDCCDTLSFIAHPNYGYACTEPQTVIDIRNRAGNISTELRTALNNLQGCFWDLLYKIEQQLQINNEPSTGNAPIRLEGLNTSGQHQLNLGSDGRLADYVQEVQRQSDRLKIQMGNALVCLDAITARVNNMKNINDEIRYDIADILDQSAPAIAKVNEFRRYIDGEASMYGQIAMDLAEWASKTNSIKWDPNSNSYNETI